MINCIGDLIMCLSFNAEVFLDDLINICDICFQAVYELSLN
jgi:hypothetical protein